MKIPGFIIGGLKLLLAGSLISVCACDRPAGSESHNLIYLNTVGYEPGSTKLAFTPAQVLPADEFEIVDVQTGETVFTGKVRFNKFADNSFGETVHELDFSQFNEPGTYRVYLPGRDTGSPSFVIGTGVYREAAHTALKSYYYQRCGTAIDGGDRWIHEVCHLEDAVFYSDPEKKKDVTGGWHDAGDYGKYSVNTAVSLAFILYLYDHHPDRFHDGQLDIPEHSNGVPDLLDEARWALRWLLKMQNDTGGVYHKVQKKEWTGEYLPQNDPDTRYIFDVSTAATAGFAAVSAMGARLFRLIDQVFSDTLATASARAWEFLERNPGIVPQGGFSNPPDVRGGAYGDTNDTDERLWASVELYRLTGDSRYHTYFLQNYRASGEPASPPVSWKDVGEFAGYSYIRMEEKDQNGEARRLVTQKIIDHADGLVRRTMDSSYRVVLDESEYYWGSNSVVLGYAFDLVQAYELSGFEMYREAALDQLHYILGRNPFGISYVTGVGSNSVEHPYHQFSIRLETEEPVPGMVVGGPNSHNRLNGQLLSEYPGKAYEDSHRNYMVNETAINYTAPFVYLAGYLSGEVERVEPLTSESTH